MNPYFQDETGLETFRKEKAMKKMIPSDTRINEMINLRTSSAPTDGPTDVKLFSIASAPRRAIIPARSGSVRERVLIL